MRPLVGPLLGLLLVACQKENPAPSSLVTAAATEADAELVVAPKIPPCTALSQAAALTPMAAGDTGGTLALARAGKRTIALVADEDDSSLVMVDVDSFATLGTTRLAGKPSKLLVLADGRVVVALADKSALEVLEPEGENPFPLARRCLVDVPAEPVGLAVTPDRKNLLVVSRWGHALSTLDVAAMAPRNMVELPRDPVAVMASRDGKRAFVTHAAGGALSVVELEEEAPKTRAVPIEMTQFTDIHFGMMRPMPEPRFPSTAEKPKKKRRPPSARHDRQGGQAFSLVRAETGKLLAPLVLVEPRAPKGSSSGYGSASTDAPPAIGEIAAIDEASGALTLPAATQGIGPSDCLLPRAAALDEARGEIHVACLGIDAIVTYDATKKYPHAHERRRVRVPAGPTGVVIDPEGRRAVVFSQYAGALSVVSLADKGKKKTKEGGEAMTLVLKDRAGLSPELALGRALFHAAGKRRVAFDGRACASCHPDGRDDGFTWSTQEGPRQTPILLGRLEGSAPFGWLGDKKDLPSHFSRTVERLAGTGLKAAERDAIFAWVKSLAPPRARPRAAEERLARGKTIFESEEAACGTCHFGEASTDGDNHDVSSAEKFQPSRDFETPSLRFIARSAPYFHDGRYATILDMLKGSDGTMGKTGHLASDDVEALAAYVESL